jgi:hypothetical protein
LSHGRAVKQYSVVNLTGPGVGPAQRMKMAAIRDRIGLRTSEDRSSFWRVRNPYFNLVRLADMDP